MEERQEDAEGEISQETFGERWRCISLRVEKAYLELLRTLALVFATLLLLYVAWLAVTAAYNIARDPDAVEVEPVTINAEEIVNLVSQGETLSNEEKEFNQFRDQYFRLYQERFEAFNQSDDKTLNVDEFTNAFLAMFDNGQLSGEDESFTLVPSSDFPGLLQIMSDAADFPVTAERLTTYQNALKERIVRQSRRTRNKRVCERYTEDGWYIRCVRYGNRTVPYTETNVEVRLPEGVLTPRQLFATYQENYLSELSARRENNESVALNEREERAAANLRGRADLASAAQLILGFLAVMFLFLLIAIERHQRKIAARLDRVNRG